MASQLIVKISADSKQLSNEYKKVVRQTEELEAMISGATKASAAAFIGFAGAIGLAANEAAKIETIGVQFEVLTGSAEKAKKVVEELTNFAAKTPFQFEGIAQSAQQLLGFQVAAEDITPTLQRLGDVSAAVGAPLSDLTLVFGQVRAAGKLTGERLIQLQERAVPIGPALAKTLGVAEESIKDLVSRGQVDFETFERAFASISEKGGVAFEGMAKRSQTLEGVISTLKDNFSLLAADIGKQFLPVLKVMSEGLTNIIQFVRDNPVFASLAGKMLALGAALSGVATILGVAGLAFLKIRAAMIAAQVSAVGLGVAVKSLVGATGIGLLVIVATEVFARWDQIWPAMKVIFEDFGLFVVKWLNVLKTAFTSFGSFLGEIGSGIGSILKGAFTFDFEAIQEGLNKVRETLKEGVSNIQKDIAEEIKKQDSIIELKVAARKEGDGATSDEGTDPTIENEKKKTAAVNEETQKRIDALNNEKAILKAQAEGLSAQQIDFIKRKQDLELEAVEASRILNEQEKAAAIENLRLKEDALLVEMTEATDRRRELEAEIREGDAELALELDEIAKESRTIKEVEELEALRSSLLTKQEAADAVRREELKRNIDSNNQRLKDEVRFGETFAKINQAVNSNQINEAQNAAGKLVQLTQSKNNTLKSIGKAAALTQIGIDTAKGATAAYASLAPIPFVGPALGIAAAAALIAFGVEQASGVLAANQGGMVPRNIGIPGVDSVPASLTPGELIVPAQNFDEVVNSVADRRRGSSEGGGSQGATGSQGITNVYNINGDVLADETFIDRMIDGINEAVEERNATLSATAIV